MRAALHVTRSLVAISIVVFFLVMPLRWKLAGVGVGACAVAGAFATVRRGWVR